MVAKIIPIPKDVLFVKYAINRAMLPFSAFIALTVPMHQTTLPKYKLFLPFHIKSQILLGTPTLVPHIISLMISPTLMSVLISIKVQNKSV